MKIKKKNRLSGKIIYSNRNQHRKEVEGGGGWGVGGREVKNCA